MKIALISTALSIASTALTSGFAGSCRYYYLNPVDEHTLAGSCKQDSGSELFSTLDLNSCLGNSVGQLQWARNGNGLKSCSPCNLDKTKLDCQCETGKGDKHDTSIDLNDKVGNDNGKLVCGI